MDSENKSSVIIGKYIIDQKMTGDSVYISNADDEGGEFFISDLESVLDKFWKEYF